MGYVPREALDNLKKYAYKGVDKSLTSKYILNPFWTWFVTLWPTSVAPNTITLSGLSIVIFNFLTLLYYDPGYTGIELPRWVYFSFAIGLFAYQSFDAIDGKQARRTGMAGPLGEMFDHGCDAINTTLEAVIASHALNLNRSWWVVASQVATLANFYLTTWEEYHTGSLYLGVFSGPVEGILMIVGIYIISGLYGPQVWDTPTFTFLGIDHLEVLQGIPNIGLNEAFMVFGGFGLAFNIFTSYYNVLNTSHRSRSPDHPLVGLFPFVISAAIQIFWLAHPDPEHPENSAIINSALFVPFLCSWGLQFAHMVGRMILAHVTSMPFPMWDAAGMWLWSLVGAVDGNAEWLFGVKPLVQSSDEGRMLFVYLTLLISFLNYGRFCYLVINEITEYLGIACFTVRKKGKDGEWHSAVKDTKKE